ncbi:MAG: primosomal protein N', partial [Calditrichia bacterium]|nr:primosomal protein N' [Calditrichia bacterium]
EMESEIKIGQIVLAKVKTNYYSGIVVGIKNREQVNLNIKFIPISDIIEKESLVTKELIELSQWIAEYYISFWGEVVSLILPPGILQKSKKMVRLKPGADGQKTKINGTQKKIIEFIKDKNYVSLSSIKKKTKISNIHYHIQRLKELEILEEKSELSKKSAVKLFEYFYKLKETDEEKIKEILHPNAFLQKTAIEALRENYPQPLSQTYLNSIIDVSTTVLNRLRELKIIEREKKEVLRKLQWEININLAHLELNGAQQKVVDYFIPAVPEEKIEKNYTPALLWGVTGSGKTQVYIEIARKVLEAGRNVLILVPEISLTPQLISRFKFYLQQEVGAYHSKLSAGERFDIWRRVSRGELKIVVGARSAVFMPFKDIGLIVIDEEHEYSYKQTDTSPRYNARDVAMYIASKQKSIYITGSATPSMESLYLCKNNRMKLLQLNKRVKQLPLPRIHVTDLNHSALNEQDGSQLTENLLMEIQSRLLVKEQTLLFKNIRGYASYLQCEDCNSIIKCSKCDVTLTYHKKGKYLSCHYCGAEEPVLDVCP